MSKHFRKSWLAFERRPGWPELAGTTMLPRPHFHTFRVLMDSRAFVDPDLVEGHGRHGRIGRLVRYLEATRQQRCRIPGKPRPLLWYWLHLRKITEAYTIDGSYFATVKGPIGNALPMMEWPTPPTPDRATLKAFGYELC